MRQWLFAFLLLSLSDISYGQFHIDSSNSLLAIQPLQDFDLEILNAINHYAELHSAEKTAEQLHVVINSLSLHSLEKFIHTFHQSNNQSCGLIRGSVSKNLYSAAFLLLAEYAQKIRAFMQAKSKGYDEHLFSIMQFCLADIAPEEYESYYFHSINACASGSNKLFQVSLEENLFLIQNLRSFQRLTFLFSVLKDLPSLPFETSNLKQIRINLIDFRIRYMTSRDALHPRLTHILELHPQRKEQICLK